jgi:serine/threonine-protein kinase
VSEPHDHNRTVDHSSVRADSLDAGLAAGFAAPRSSLDASQRPVLLKEAEGESSHVLKAQSDAVPAPEHTGSRYQLQGEIARGGMGAVLRGRDVDLGRDLAVKVLLEKHAHRPEVARRFLEEAQIGGQLQHPGVVPVYDVGRFGERPFFTMKLIKGQTLAALLSERADSTVDRPRLLGIALQVAQTLAYAHAKGVIHRDLKPANIMVGAFGEVQVMDWGLAKVLSEGGSADVECAASRERERPEPVTTIRTARNTGSAGTFGTQTEAGSLLGTPAYMPPEQANGDVALLNRRADVFGLGAILCEILTGKPPYVGRSSEEVRRKACNGDRADAIARLDGCEADQELIVLTKACLSPEAIDRPKNAQAVAEGLTAYLDGVQERLRQAELAEAEARARAIEEARRRRLTLALAATVLLAVTLGGGGWLWVKNERDARQAQLTRDVNDALNQAAALREKSKAANGGRAALFAQAREQAQRALALVESGPADDTLTTQVRLLQTELDREEKDRKLVAALDEARLEQAKIVAGQNRFASERAVPKFREAFRAYGLSAGEGESTAAAARIRQRPPWVREAIVAALDEWDDLASDKALGITEPHREWLRAVLEAAQPDDAWGRQVRAARREIHPAKRQARLEALARSAKIAELPAGALTRLARQLHPPEAAKLLRLAQQHYPSDFWVNHDLGMTLREVPSPGRDEAVRFLTVAVALRPESPGAVYHLGALFCDEKRDYDAAITWFRKAVAMNPNDAFPHFGLGNALRGKGQVDEAIASFQKAIELDPKLAEAHCNLGYALTDKGRVDEAIASYRQALEVDPKLAKAYCGLGQVFKGKGQVDEAIAIYRKAVLFDPTLVDVHLSLGAILCDVKRDYDGAIACFRRCIRLDPKNALAHSNLGNSLAGKGEVDAAIASYQKAIELDPTLVNAHRNLGATFYNYKRDYAAAIACFRKAVDLEPKNAGSHFYLGLALLNSGNAEEAVASFQKAALLDPKNATVHFKLGVTLAGKGQLEEAIACYRKAIELDPKDPRMLGALGQALLGKGRYAEAKEASVRVMALLPERHPLWAVASGQVAACERFLKLEERLPRLLRGQDKANSAQEWLDLATICQRKRMHASAARFFAHAFAADAKLADDLRAGRRYNAACDAALASAAKGEDAAALDGKERARLRQQALYWLKADLAHYEKRLQSGSRTPRRLVTQQMKHWQKDGDLAGIRDKVALAKLSAEERAACEKLWADVAALLKKAETPTQKEGK